MSCKVDCCLYDISRRSIIDFYLKGHPYEPMLAVSGIDHTVKIFSPDAYARSRAKKGIGLTPTNPSDFSSSRLGLRRFRSTAADDTTEPEGQAAVPASDARDLDSGIYFYDFCS